jgi:phosphomannomutase
MIPGRLRAQVEAWIADDPDPGDRAELRALLDGGPAAEAEIAERFRGRLAFGTAGLRGAVGAGPNRMNRAVVRGATAALAGWLREHDPGAAVAGVVIGCDARFRSDELADEAAGVLAGAGIRVHLLPRQRPTPLLAFAVRHLAAAAGIMITASHNPPADNGYKLYLGDGAQIVPPVDAEIELAILALGPLSGIPADPLDSALVTRHGDEIAAAYLDAITAVSQIPSPAHTGPDQRGPVLGPPGPAEPPAARTGLVRSRPDQTVASPLRVVYTPLHGVAGGLAVEAIERAGYPAPHVVAAQAEPDPRFPTVAFPNPEEPGALDLALAEARRIGADLVLANDPDGDRLAVAVPDPSVLNPSGTGGWRVLTGDQLGTLLGAYLLERTAAEPSPGTRLVVTTIVSSTLLSRIARSAGVRFATALTGFKWIVRAGQGQSGSRFVFGYEEALGYAVGDIVRDKDGISAALAVLGLAAGARSAGASLLDRYDALETEHGVHLTAQFAIATGSPADVMARLRSSPPSSLADQPVLSAADLAGGTSDLPPADVLVYRLPGARVVIRPSGTEPKLKSYFEIIEPVPSQNLATARDVAEVRLTLLRDAVKALITA